jgi:hypothetical protein
VKGVTGRALIAWRRFSAKFPDAVMTSGRREIADQARAMARNVAENRRWIARTYKYPLCKVARALQLWVDAHAKATEEQIREAFVMVMRRFSREELAKLSVHFLGLAFDVMPIGGERGEAMKEELRALAFELGGLFLESEGGRTVWHLQFKPEPEVEA